MDVEGPDELLATPAVLVGFAPATEVLAGLGAVLRASAMSFSALAGVSPPTGNVQKLEYLSARRAYFSALSKSLCASDARAACSSILPSVRAAATSLRTLAGESSSSR